VVVLDTLRRHCDSPLDLLMHVVAAVRLLPSFGQHGKQGIKLLFLHVGSEILHILIEENLKVVVDPLEPENIIKVAHHASRALPPVWLRPSQERIDRPMLEKPVPPHILESFPPALPQCDLIHG